LTCLTRLARLEANDAVLLLLAALLGTAGQYKEKTPPLRRSSLMVFWYVVNVHVVVTGGLPTSIVPTPHPYIDTTPESGSMSDTVHTPIDEFDSSRTLTRPLSFQTSLSIEKIARKKTSFWKLSRFNLSSLPTPPPCAKNNAPR